MSKSQPADETFCSAEDVRNALAALMPDTARYWQRPLHAYASVVYDVDPFHSNCSERNYAMDRLGACVEQAARRAGFGAMEASSARRQILEAPVLQTGPHRLLLIEPDAFYTHLFSLLGLKAQGRQWHISYAVSTTSFIESAKKGPGWLELEGEPLNLFGLPRSRMNSHSICCPAGPYSFSLTNSRGRSAPNASAARLLEELPRESFPSAAEAIRAANQALWRSRFGTQVNLLQLDDFDIASLVADHLDDAQSWLPGCFIGDGAVAEDILSVIDDLNRGPWSGWIRRTTDFFWGVENHRTIPLRYQDKILSATGSSGFRIEFEAASLADALRARAILPNLFMVFLVISILSGVRVLGGCRQTIYYPLMRYLASIAIGRSQNSDLLMAIQEDYRPGLWGHRTLTPHNGAPFRELELAGGVAPLLLNYAQQSLQEASGDLPGFTKGAIWSDLCRHLVSGAISARSDAWRWSGL